MQAALAAGNALEHTNSSPQDPAGGSAGADLWLTLVKPMKKQSNNSHSPTPVKENEPTSNPEIP
jgi:hypothetical protein